MTVTSLKTDTQETIEILKQRMLSPIHWRAIEKVLSVMPTDEVRNALQSAPWAVPKGDVTLETGVILRPIIGYGDFHKKLAESDPEFAETYKGMKRLIRDWRDVRTGLVVSCTLDDNPHGSLLHISMSYPNRDPSWEEIKAVRTAFFPPFIDVMMVLPASDNYVNVHEHCFHLWQCPSAWNIG